MNKLSGTRVYLAGLVESDPAGAKSWREQITSKLGKYNVNVYNPLVKPRWLPDICKVDVKLYKDVLAGKSTELPLQSVFDGNTAVRRICLRMVSSADWVICYLPRIFTAGTFEELYLAAQLEKPVLFCIPETIPPTWVLPIFANAQTMDETYFNNWDSLMEHVDKLNNGSAPMDPYKWLSVNYTPEYM